jgi:hypothetical protein
VSHLNKRDRMRILEFSAEIAAEASCNPNVVFMIEFQEMLIEATYRKTVALLEADLDDREDDEADQADEARDGDDDYAPGSKAPASTSAGGREKTAAAAAPAERSRARKPSNA